MGPREALVAKAWIGHAQLSTVGRAALGPRPHLRKSQRRCPTLTLRKGHDTKPCSLPMGHLGCRCPGLTAPLSHVLPTVGDDHLLLGLPVLAALGLNLPQDVQAIRDLPKHYMLAVQPIRLVTHQEELGAVGVWAGVGHGQQAWSRVFEDKVFIVKLLPVDGLAPGAIVVGEITALAHELGDDAVETAALEAKASM